MTVRQSMKKILVIGGTGQVGGAVVSDAPSCGFEPFHFPKRELDVTNAAQVEDKIKAITPDVVVNATAYHVVPQCEEHPEEAMQVNAVAVYRLAKLCKQYRSTLVTYSTDYVFDGEKGTLMDEEDSVHPLQVYGISKAAGEFAALAVYPEGSFIVRTSALYGGKEGSRSKGGNFVLNILKEAQGQDTLEVSKEQIVSPTFAGDLSKATLKLLQIGAASGIYHLVNEGYCSLAEFTQEIFRVADLPTRVSPVDRGARSGTTKRPKFSALRNTRAKKLGVVLPHWQEGVASYFKLLQAI